MYLWILFLKSYLSTLWTRSFLVQILNNSSQWRVALRLGEFNELTNVGFQNPNLTHKWGHNPTWGSRLGEEKRDGFQCNSFSVSGFAFHYSRLINKIVKIKTVVKISRSEWQVAHPQFKKLLLETRFQQKKIFKTCQKLSELKTKM